MCSTDSAAWLDAAADRRLGSVQAATLPGGAAGVQGWAAAVTGAVLPHVYELLGDVVDGPGKGETAEQLLARVPQLPEIDGHGLVAGMGRVAFEDPEVYGDDVVHVD